jgi:hypothetical protein
MKRKLRIIVHLKMKKPNKKIQKMKLYSQSHNHNPNHSQNQFRSPSPLYQNLKKLNKKDKLQKQLKLL